MKEYRFKDFNIIGDGFRAEIRLSSLNPLFKRAQYYLSEQYLQACRARMPLRTGSLQQLSHTEDEGRKIVFPGPYARFLYYGKVMVDSQTGKGAMRWVDKTGNEYIRFRKGAVLRPTDRDLTYTTDFHKNAGAYWIERSEAVNKDKWLALGKRVMNHGE